MHQLGGAFVAYAISFAIVGGFGIPYGTGALILLISAPVLLLIGLCLLINAEEKEREKNLIGDVFI